MSEDKDFKLKDIDEGLNNWIITQINMSSDFYYRGDYMTVFRIYKLIFNSISCYEYKNKQHVNELTETLEDYFTTLSGKPANQHEKLVMGQKTYELRYLIDMYYQLMVEVLNSIGKWLKVYRIKDDADEEFSKNTFGTNLSLVDNKKEELKSLKSEEILGFCSPNMIHFIHSRFLIYNAQRNT